MKTDLARSRLFWLACASGTLSSLSAGLAPAGAPPWVVLIVSALAAGCAAGAAYLRAEDIRAARSRTVGQILADKGK